MRVIQTIQSTRNPHNPPVEMPYYTGDNLALALAALVSAASDHANDPEWVDILSVRIEFS